MENDGNSLRRFLPCVILMTFHIPSPEGQITFVVGGVFCCPPSDPVLCQPLTGIYRGL